MKTLRMTLNKDKLIVHYFRPVTEFTRPFTEVVLENLEIKAQKAFGCDTLLSKETYTLEIFGTASKLYKALVWIVENLNGATGKITIEDEDEDEDEEERE